MTKTMVVVLGPTGIGKTNLGIILARTFQSVIISADSRQVYKEIPIGTAAPTADEQARATHFMVGTRSVFDYYNASQYEHEALALAKSLFKTRDILFMVGGSMMYIDAFCNGMDDLPTVEPEVRDELMNQLRENGIEAMRRQLKQLDADFYARVDLKNPKRVLHALEICLMTGKPYSLLRTNSKKQRPFRIVKIGLNMERDELYQRINNRVIHLVEKGLLDETERLIPHQHLNALNTVGYKELFEYFKGKSSMSEALTLIQRNSRHYSKKQMSWFRRDKEINWFHPSNVEGIVNFLQKLD